VIVLDGSCGLTSTIPAKERQGSMPGVGGRLPLALQSWSFGVANALATAVRRVGTAAEDSSMLDARMVARARKQGISVLQ
jgi:hypothetical protein